MRLEADKLRTVLFEVETILPNSYEMGNKFVEDILNKHSFNKNELIEYLLLLKEAGFIRIGMSRTNDGELTVGALTGLTFDGHEFLNAIREDSNWNKIKGYLKKTGSGASIEAIKYFGLEIIKSF